MGIQGMELCAVAVVILLFIAVLKQFGILEPISVEDSGDADVELPSARHQPEELEQLLARTKFTKAELQSLYRGFKNECPSGLVDEETFTLIYSRFFPQGDASSYAHFLFDAFDADRHGALCFQVGIPGGNGRASSVIHHGPPPLLLLLLLLLLSPPRPWPVRGKNTGINGDEIIPGAAGIDGGREGGREGRGTVPVPPRPLRQDFAVGLSVLLRGTEQQKLKWTFDLYDVNKDGYITKEVTVGDTGGLAGLGTAGRGPASALCPPGHAGDHEVHLCHDGPLHRARAGQQRASPARGALLPEDGQEQGRRGDLRGVPGHVPGGQGHHELHADLPQRALDPAPPGAFLLFQTNKKFTGRRDPACGSRRWDRTRTGTRTRTRTTLPPEPPGHGAATCQPDPFWGG
ncbi:uncharacterized protein [Taeniopygia guttata]|uniref:uncharacterized protein isoform X2 n=1 Tax=Taeniopygia guttata TaxID=59729 RepID=UPI003BB943C8